MELLFSSFLIHACEQLHHLKEILNPLIELSGTLDSVARNPAEIFRANSAKNQPNNGGKTIFIESNNILLRINLWYPQVIFLE